MLRELRKLRRAPSEGNRLRAGTHEQTLVPLVLTPSAAAEQQAQFPRRLRLPVGGSPFGVHGADGGAREGHRLGYAGGRDVAPGGRRVRVALRVELGAREPAVRCAGPGVADVRRAAVQRVRAGEGGGGGGGDQDRVPQGVPQRDGRP